MKFGFVTCVQLGKSCMEAIYEIGGQLDLAITLEDTQAINKSGRVFLDDFCLSNNIPLVKSSNINNEDCVAAIKKYEIDWLFIIGWSQIANSEILSAPYLGTLGMHPTLLPVGRGRASIPWAIIKELSQTGVTLFKLDEGVDTGDILEQQVIPMSKDITATQLYELVNIAHVDLIRSILPSLQDNRVQLTKQDSFYATDWAGRTPSDGEIDQDGSVFDAERLVRATTFPYPGAFFMAGNMKTIIWEAKILEKGTSSSGKTLSFKDGNLALIKFEELVN